MREIPKVILGIDSSRAYGRGLLRGIAKYSRIFGPWAFYSEPGVYGKVVTGLKKWGANGIITQITNEKLIKDIILPGIAAVAIVVKSEISGLPNVIGNWAKDGEMGAEYLLSRGFTKLAFCGFGNMQWSRERCESFRRRVAKAGFETYIYDHPWIRLQRSWEREQNYILNWLKGLPKPVAIMACNDDRGRHILEACKLAGLNVPEEVAVLGVDNDETVCDLTVPLLSSIAVDTERAGYQAAALLEKIMGGKDMSKGRIMVQPLCVVTRQSTDVTAIEDKEVADAVRFIRQHSKSPLQVGDVADSIAISRRGLERRFRKSVGRSVHEEIRRIRTEEVVRMLVETNASISQIAVTLGFESVDHLSRFFRQEKGISPLVYRKQFLASYLRQ